MISDSQNLETYRLNAPRSVSAECENARRYIAQITELEMRFSNGEGVRSPTASPALLPSELYPHLPALSRLKTALNAALDDAQTNQPGSNDDPSEQFEQALLEAADLRWLCNQCDYYFSVSSPLAPARQTPEVRRQWHIRSVRRALRYLKAIATIRNLLLKP